MLNAIHGLLQVWPHLGCTPMHLPIGSLQAHVGLSFEDRYLAFAGVPLDDSKSLAEYNIPAEAHLRMAVRLRQGLQLLLLCTLPGSVYP